jgi:hypothetical protein
MFQTYLFDFSVPRHEEVFSSEVLLGEDEPPPMIRNTVLGVMYRIFLVVLRTLSSYPEFLTAKMGLIASWRMEEI